MGLLLAIALILVLVAVLGGILLEPLLWLILIGAVVALVIGLMNRGGRSTA